MNMSYYQLHFSQMSLRWVSKTRDFPSKQEEKEVEKENDVSTEESAFVLCIEDNGRHGNGRHGNGCDVSVKVNNYKERQEVLSFGIADDQLEIITHAFLMICKMRRSQKRESSA